MKAKNILPLAIVISILLIQLSFAALPRYEIIDLGTLGGEYSCAYSVNDSVYYWRQLPTHNNDFLRGKENEDQNKTKLCIANNSNAFDSAGCV
jgi:hypothetical protein